MQKITTDSSNNQQELIKEKTAESVGKDYQSHSYENINDTDSEERKVPEDIESVSERQFGSMLSREDQSDTNLLLKGIQETTVCKSSKTEKPFHFKEAIEQIKSSPKDQDKELSLLFRSIVNPWGAEGHCARCAFYTHLYLNGHMLKKAEPGEYPSSQEFSDWFYSNFFPNDEVTLIEGIKGEPFIEFKNRVENTIKKVTNPGEAVVISISDASHWYNAYNDGNKVWFIDSQTGRGFNLYSSDTEVENERVHLVKINTEKIAEYEQLSPTWKGWNS